MMTRPGHDVLAEVQSAMPLEPETAVRVRDTVAMLEEEEAT